MHVLESASANHGEAFVRLGTAGPLPSAAEGAAPPGGGARGAASAAA